MTLTEALKVRIQDVADAAGQAGREDEFEERYKALLCELVGAMRVMRGVAGMQCMWLQGQVGQRARAN